MKKQLLEESLQDVKDDFEQLLYLFSSTQKQLQIFRKDSEKQKKHILSFTVLLPRIKEYEKKYSQIITQLQEKKETITEKQLLIRTKETYHYADMYRSLQSIVAGLIISTDWQSPTFAHSLSPLAGRQNGEIIANYNDYKRDQHLDAKMYAQQFRNAYIDGLFKFTIPTYLTNSGMAALVTIINFLRMYKQVKGPVLLGSSSYFQNKELIKKLFTEVLEVHEHETEKIKKLIQEKTPQVLFFDSLCNSSDIAVPHIKEIMKTFTQEVTKDTYIVIDNTCLGPSFQPLKLLGKFPKQIHMIVFESLNKYYQYGLDKTMGGVIYTYGRDMHELFFARQHSGTIISDGSCYLLPTPQKTVLTKRLRRHERNVQVILQAVAICIQTEKHFPINSIVYPCLPTHPSYAWTKDFTFHGSFFTFSWNKKYDTINTYKKYIKSVLQEAKKANINIVEGTSFGMNTSRIYLTASTTKFGKPFVRFSVGTENRYEIEKIKDVLITAFKKL